GIGDVLEARAVLLGQLLRRAELLFVLRDGAGHDADLEARGLGRGLRGIGGLGLLARASRHERGGGEGEQKRQTLDHGRWTPRVGNQRVTPMSSVARRATMRMGSANRGESSTASRC